MAVTQIIANGHTRAGLLFLSPITPQAMVKAKNIRKIMIAMSSLTLLNKKEHQTAAPNTLSVQCPRFFRLGYINLQ